MTGFVIAPEFTDTSVGFRHPTKTDDAEASLREKLAAQIAAAQSDIATHIARLRDMPSSGNLLVQAQAQQSNLSSLQSRIANADAVTLGSIGAEIAATVVAAQSLAQQAQGSNSTLRDEQGALREASEGARKTTNDFVRDFYDKHEFDKYLNFASANDEEEYRKREAERHKAIEEALAKHTPEGNLEANRLAIAQLKDAGAHGASRSALYQKDMDKLESANANLTKAIGADRETKSASVSVDPLDAASPLPNVSPELLAGLKRSGVTVPDQQGHGHGLSAGTSQPVAQGRS